MSLSVEEARQRFNDDATLRELLGSEFVDAYLSVNETLMDWIKPAPNSADRTSTRLYVEHW